MTDVTDLDATPIEPTHKVAEDLLPLLTPTDTLTNLPGNPRRGDVDAIATSMDRFGMNQAILYAANDEGELIVYAGNHRLLAAIQLGWTHVAAINASHMTREELNAYALADNRTGDLGTYDEVELLAFIDLVNSSPVEIEATGYGYADIEAIRDGVKPSDHATAHNYTRKIKSPIYEPKLEEPPPITELVNTDKTDALMHDIQAAFDKGAIDDELYGFLAAAATRHNRFSFERIAEFYAHADADVQQLMEESALVIIDFEQAIELNYVKLTRKLDEEHQRQYHGVDPDPDVIAPLEMEDGRTFEADEVGA